MNLVITLWEEYNLNAKTKRFEKISTHEFIGGMCSFLYLLSKCLSLSCMKLETNGKTIDPEVVSMKYMDDAEGNISISGDTKSCITLEYMGKQFNFYFNTIEFYNGFKYACEISGRKYKTYIKSVKLSESLGKINSSIRYYTA